MAGSGPNIGPLNQARLREIIKTREILERLQKHILGKSILTTTQVRAAEVVLRKVHPDLQATALSADDTLELPILKIIKRDAA